MKVFSLLGEYEYHGLDLVGVYASLEDLMKFAKSKEFPYDHLYYVESVLGEPVDRERIMEL